MKSESETPTNVTDKPSEKSKVVPLSTLIALLSGAAFFSSPSKSEVLETPSDTSSLAVRWMEEVRTALGEVPCRHPDDASQRRFLRSVDQDLSTWRSRSHIIAGQNLEAAREIQGFLSCEGKNVSAEMRARLEGARGEFLNQIEGQLRAKIALLRRARLHEGQEDPKRLVREMRDLLEAHSGPLSEQLAELESQFRGEN
jgi:hypothetical protein